MINNSLSFLNEFRIIIYMIKTFTSSNNYKKELKDLNTMYPRSNIMRLSEWIEDLLNQSINLLFKS